MDSSKMKSKLEVYTNKTIASGNSTKKVDIRQGSFWAARFDVGSATRREYAGADVTEEATTFRCRYDEALKYNVKQGSTFIESYHGTRSRWEVDAIWGDPNKAYADIQATRVTSDGLEKRNVRVSPRIIFTPSLPRVLTGRAGTTQDYILTIPTGAGLFSATTSDASHVDVSYNSTTKTLRVTYPQIGNATITLHTEPTQEFLAYNVIREAKSNTLATPPSMFNVVVDGDSTIRLSWGLPTHDGNSPILEYQIQRHIGLASFTDYTTTTSLTFTDVGLEENTTYNYRIATITAVGISPYSSSLSGTTGVTPQLPGIPTSLSLSVSSSTQIAVSWIAPSDTGNTNLTGYRVQRSTDGLDWNVGIVEVGNNYIDTGLEKGTQYYYRVAAINGVGEGAFTSAENETTDIDVPGLPTEFQTVLVERNSIELDWFEPDDNGGAEVTNYQLQFSTNGVDWVDEILQLDLVYIDTGLTHNTTYYYRVAAINSAGQGLYTSALEVLTSASVPDAPTALRVVSKTSDTINLAWTAPVDNGGSDLINYYLDISSDGITYNITETIAASITTYAHTGLNEGDTFYYRVSVDSASGNSVESTPLEVTTTVAIPDSPTNLRVDATGDDRILLRWDAPSGGVITGYRVQRSITGISGSWTSEGTTPNHTISITGLNRGTTRYYRVATYNDSGTSAYTAFGSATTWNVPDAPALTADAVSHSRINLSWTTPSDNGDAISLYTLETSLTGNGSWNVLTTQAGTTYAHTGITNHNRAHFYRVLATNSVGNSDWSDNASATTHATVPGHPTNFRVADTTDNQISLAWDAPGNNGGETITDYQIQRSTDGTIYADYDTATSTVFVDTGLNPNTQYWYQVAARNSEGLSTYTSPVSSTTLVTLTVPGVPTSLMVVVIDPTTIDLTWVAPLDNGGSLITQFEIRRSEDNVDFELLTTVDDTTLTYNDIGLEPSTEYFYQIAAVNSEGTGVYTDSESATTEAPPAALRISVTTLATIKCYEV